MFQGKIAKLVLPCVVQSYKEISCVSVMLPLVLVGGRARTLLAAADHAWRYCRCNATMWMHRCNDMQDYELCSYVYCMDERGLMLVDIRAQDVIIRSTAFAVMSLVCIFTWLGLHYIGV